MIQTFLILGCKGIPFINKKRNTSDFDSLKSNDLRQTVGLLSVIDISLFLAKIVGF